MGLTRRGWALMAVVAVASGLVGYAAAPEGEEHALAARLRHPHHGPSAARQFVAALWRADGMAYGDWAQERMLRRCPAYAQREFRYSVLRQGDDFDVYLDVRPGPTPGPECPGRPFGLATVVVETGELLPIPDPIPNVTPYPRTGPSWLADFRGGAAP